MKFVTNIFFAVALGFLAFFGNFALAQSNQQANAKMTEMKNLATKLNQLPNTDPEAIVGLAIRVLMWFMGAIMFALVAYAGALWMTASGNTEKIGKAKNILVWSALGVSVMLMSYVIVNFVFSRIEKGGI